MSLEKSPGALSEAAKRVMPYLSEIHEALQQPIEELGVSLTQLTNEVAESIVKNEPDMGKIVDLKLAMARKESELLVNTAQGNNTERDTVIANFFRKTINNLGINNIKPTQEAVPENEPPAVA